MESSIRKYSQATSLILQIKTLKKSGESNTHKYMNTIGQLRDLIFDLSHDCEFCMVKKLAEETTTFITKGDGTSLSDDHLLFCIAVFPTLPGGMIDLVSTSFDVNIDIVESASRTLMLSDEKNIADTFVLAMKLAEAGDIDSWLTLCKYYYLESQDKSLILKSLASFENKLLASNIVKFEPIVNYLEDYNPKAFLYQFDGIKISPESIRSNLKSLGLNNLITSILNGGEISINSRFELMRLEKEYGFIPDKNYLSDLKVKYRNEKSDVGKFAMECYCISILSKAPDGEASTLDNLGPDRLIQMVKLNGLETEYGTINLLMKTIGLYIDRTINVSAGKQIEAIAICDYLLENGMPKKYLDQSNTYKGLRLENWLGI